MQITERRLTTDQCRQQAFVPLGLWWFCGELEYSDDVAQYLVLDVAGAVPASDPHSLSRYVSTLIDNGERAIIVNMQVVADDSATYGDMVVAGTIVARRQVSMSIVNPTRQLRDAIASLKML